MVHRPLERLTQLLSWVYFACCLMDLTIANQMAAVVFASWLLGLIEGVRTHMAPSFFSYLGLQFNLLPLSLYFCGLLAYEVLNWLYGRGDFSKYPDCPEAPYDCGYKSARSKVYGNEVRVFYPVKKGGNYEDVPFLEHGVKSLYAYAKLAFKFNPSGSLGPVLVSMTRLVKMGTARDAPLAEDFRGKKIVPVFFSHGMVSTG